jgi:hypothetical protein
MADRSWLKGESLEAALSPADDRETVALTLRFTLNAAILAGVDTACVLSLQGGRGSQGQWSGVDNKGDSGRRVV